jgi:hypothetical protein
MSIEIKKGKQSVRVCVDDDVSEWEKGTWYFCTDGQATTGVKITVEQFDMLKTIVNSPEVVEYYESIRQKGRVG